MSRRLFQALRDMDVRAVVQLYRDRGVTIDNETVIRASMHKARCSMGTSHFTADELTRSRVWLRTYGFDAPIGRPITPIIKLPLGPKDRRW